MCAISQRHLFTYVDMSHLSTDCIGSAFNAKNKMQCPNCRNIEPGEWRYPIDRPTPGFNPVRPTPDFNPVGRTAEREVTPLVTNPHLCMKI